MVFRVALSIFRQPRIAPHLRWQKRYLVKLACFVIGRLIKGRAKFFTRSCSRELFAQNFQCYH